MEPKDRIIHHATALFMRRGIRSVSMDDIAADLAVSKKTLYKSFTNKDELVMAVINGQLTQSQGTCMSVQATATNAVEELFNLSRWAEKQFSQVHPSIFYDLRKYHAEAWQLFQTHKNSFILNQMRENLRRGIAEGLFRPDLDVEVLARLNLAQIDLTFDLERFPLDEFTPSYVNRVFDDHFLRGVVTLTGYQLLEEYLQRATA